MSDINKKATDGGHIVTFCEVHFDGSNATIINDSGDFTVEYYDVQKKFTLRFERDITKTAISLTPFYTYVGDDPYLSVHAARQGSKELGVVLSDGGSAFAREGCGFWIMVVYLKCIPE